MGFSEGLFSIPLGSSDLSIIVDSDSSELRLKFLNTAVQGSDLDLVLLSISRDVDIDLALSSQSRQLIVKIVDLISEVLDGTTLIVSDVGDARSVLLKGNKLFSQKSVLSISLSH